MKRDHLILPCFVSLFMIYVEVVPRSPVMYLVLGIVPEKMA